MCVANLLWLLSREWITLGQEYRGTCEGDCAYQQVMHLA